MKVEVSQEIRVDSPKVKYDNDYITTEYNYETSHVEKQGSNIIVHPETTVLNIRTNRRVPRLGVMLVGWGGNNGTTLTAALIANKLGLSWQTKRGVQHANWFGSLTQSSTVKLGTGPDGQEFYVPMSKLLPLVSPDDIIVDGWDISSMNIADAMERAQVLDYALQVQVKPHLGNLKPRASIYDPDFIASNQRDRADNLVPGNKYEQYQQICADIDDFKSKHALDTVIVLWTANTERFSEIIPGVNDTADNLNLSLKNSHAEIAPSTIFAMAAIAKKCTYINGAPQNTFVPGLVELAERENVMIGGDDFKSGQTKLKSVLVDFLVSAGIKPVSIVSYNHLGNNDGKNLSAPLQFKSKEISKSNVVDDMVQSNSILYKPGEKPDHCVVIKYVPYVGDSKRAMDEYISEIMLGGTNTIVCHNTCEDSLLASPIILDLIILSEIGSRIFFQHPNEDKYETFHPVLSILSYLLKAPMVPHNTPVINALAKQRACIENIMRACIGLAPDNNMLLEHKIPYMMKNLTKISKK